MVIYNSKIKMPTYLKATNFLTRNTKFEEYIWLWIKSLIILY